MTRTFAQELTASPKRVEELTPAVRCIILAINCENVRPLDIKSEICVDKERDQKYVSIVCYVVLSICMAIMVYLQRTK